LIPCLWLLLDKTGLWIEAGILFRPGCDYLALVVNQKSFTAACADIGSENIA
jgi:hypothetical protein